MIVTVIDVVTTVAPAVVVKLSVWLLCVELGLEGVGVTLVVFAIPMQPPVTRATPVNRVSTKTDRENTDRRRPLANCRNRKAPNGNTAASTKGARLPSGAVPLVEARLGVAATAIVAIALPAEPEIGPGALTLHVIEATGLEQLTVTEPVK